MNGEFTGKKRFILPIFFFLCGLLFIGIGISMCLSESAAENSWVFLLLFGMAYFVASIVMVLFNHGAYLRIEGNRIVAKYHWRRRLDCVIADVAFVIPELNTLRILLKSGKQIVIMGLRNSWEVGAEMRRLGFSLEKERPEVLRTQYDHVRVGRKKALFWVIGLGIMMFVNIFLAALLTGFRDMADFTDSDWTRFAIMGAVEAITVTVFFLFALRCGRLNLTMTALHHRLCGAVIANHPLPSNHIAGIYTDEHYSGRIVVCGFPNDESVFYCVEQFNRQLELEAVHTSEIFANPADLPDEGFSSLMDITDAILTP